MKATKFLAAALLLSVACTVANAADAVVKTIVLPFDAASVAVDHRWIGSAVQHTLLADISHAAAPSGTSSANDDPTVIARIAKSSDATFVIAGQVQQVDDQVRLTAQMFDRDGHVVGSCKNSGAISDLFRIEDQLSFSLRDMMFTTIRSHRSVAPIPVMVDAGPLRVAPQPAQPVGTVPANYDNRTFREGKQRNIFNTPFYEYDGLGFGGFGFGGVGGFGFGSASVGFATGGTGQGAY